MEGESLRVASGRETVLPKKWNETGKAVCPLGLDLSKKGSLLRLPLTEVLVSFGVKSLID